MDSEFQVDGLSDDELLQRTGELVARGRRVEAALLAHLAEVDERRLYLREACPSMFAYATTRLGLSEAEAYRRITAARASRRFPQLLERVSRGELHLCAVSLLSPHLTAENVGSVLERARGRTKREIEVLVAELAPRQDVPALIRRLPADGTVELVPEGVASDASAPRGLAEPPPSRTATAAPVRRADQAVLVPIAPARFKVQFTASAELEAKIARARALLRHTIPSGDLAAIIDQAMTLLVAELERTRCAATDRPRSQAAEPSASRHVPAAIRRAVWQRDQSRCTFVDQVGRRCPAREWLEIHHEEPFARGGPSSVENLKLLCRGHNAFEAERDYGAELIRDRVAERRAPPRGLGAPLDPSAAGAKAKPVGPEDVSGPIQ